MVARSVITMNSGIVVRMYNSGDLPVKLGTGKIVAKAQVMDTYSGIRLVESNEYATEVGTKMTSGKHQNLMIEESVQHDNENFIHQIVWNQTDLTSEEQDQYSELLLKYSDLFKKNLPGRITAVEHRIELLNSTPIRSYPFRVSQTEKEQISKTIRELLDNGMIRESISPWAAPVVLAPKKDGSIRFCIDYRKLNAVTKKDVYPIPRIDDTLDKLGKAKYFTTLDMVSGYWHVHIREEDREKTAFISHVGLFEWTVMPFGLTNAPGTFQRVMDHVLAGLLGDICLVYLDDIIIYSPTFTEHLLAVERVFERLKTNNIHLKVTKCHFATKVVRYLGYVVSRDGVEPDDQKIVAIKNYPIPKKCKDVRAFVGLCNYYRRFVKNFALIATPLYELTPKNANFKWTESCQQAFEELKQRLMSTPILAHPDFTREFILETDASNIGLGAILSQEFEKGRRVIGYASRVLTPAERNYGTTDREALAVVWGTREYRPYLHGRKFLLITDHEALKYILTYKGASGRQARWCMEMMEYDFKIIHRSGKKHINADALSRAPVSESVNLILGSDRLIEAQARDVEIQKIVKEITIKPSSEFQIEQDVLVRRYTPLNSSRRARGIVTQSVLPASLVYEVIRAFHDEPLGGHLGFKKTYNKIKERFWWKGMKKDIQHWVNSCMDCAMRKSPPNLRPDYLQPIPVGQPFEMVGMDFIGPIHPKTKSGNQYILVFTDYLTKWPEAFATKDSTASTVAKYLVEEVIARHGAPIKLLSDRGKAFLSNIVDETCKLLGISQKFTTAYHPQTDGLTEKFNGTLVHMLSKFLKKNFANWDELIPYVLFAYRTSLQESTLETPFFLVYGRDPIVPIDVALRYQNMGPSDPHEYRTKLVQRAEMARQLALEQIQKAQMKYQEQYKKIGTPREFEEGDQVWIYSPVIKQGQPRKFASCWLGPFRIIEKRSPLNYVCRRNGGKRDVLTVHIARMKKFIDPLERPILPPKEWPILEDGTRLEPDPDPIEVDEEFVVGEIVDSVDQDQIEVLQPLQKNKPVEHQKIAKNGVDQYLNLDSDIVEDEDVTNQIVDVQQEIQEPTLDKDVQTWVDSL
ncbi:MAG: reverse transcriptase family protein [Vulcanimicrobiaceae bacterium]